MHDLLVCFDNVGLALSQWNEVFSVAEVRCASHPPWHRQARMHLRSKGPSAARGCWGRPNARQPSHPKPTPCCGPAVQTGLDERVACQLQPPLAAPNSSQLGCTKSAGRLDVPEPCAAARRRACPASW